MAFVTRENFEANLENQRAMTPQTLMQLREYGVADDASLRLEFFFYTDDVSKGSALADELGARAYQVEHEPSASDPEIRVITGWTTPIPMHNESALDWTEDMCRLGFKHDCEFDGWGTNPSQDAA